MPNDNAQPGAAGNARRGSNVDLIVALSSRAQSRDLRLLFVMPAPAKSSNPECFIGIGFPERTLLSFEQ